MPTCPFKTKFLVNPKAAAGKVGWEWPQVLEKLEPVVGKVDFEVTTGPTMATILTRKAIEEHYQLIVAVGGDGTVSEVANGFFELEQQLNPEAILGVLPLGNGSDFVRSLGYPPKWEDAIAKLCDSNSAIMDVGRFKCAGTRGEEIDRYFINVADFGLGSEMGAAVKKQTGLFGGKIQAFLGKAKAVMGFKNKTITYRLDDGPEARQTVSSIVIANGQFFGGGMWVAPHARLDDGKFDVLVIDQMDQMTAFKKVESFYTGAHVNDRAVKYTQASKIWCDSPEPVTVDVDGEPIGRLPCTFTIHQQAIRVKI